ncbi:MAG: DUF1232 domain-containing protein [Kiritimatiellae bacterium]|nr:DUF1232 domain-containing protein [Kiritimatiellia bacterium]
MKAERNGISDAEAAEQSRKYAGKVSEETVGEMVEKEGKLKGFFRHISVLQKYWKDVCEVFSLLKDWMAGRYPAVPWTVVATLVGALLYVLSPLDLIPDFIPGFGYVDDASVFAVALSLAGADMAKYREWKRQRAETIDAEWDEEDA